MLQLLAFLKTHLLHHLHDAVGTEQAHQIVLQRNEKVRRSRVALARTASAQLPVNAPRLVAFRAQHVQTAHFGHAGAELDVRAAARHVRGDGDGAALAGARDNFRFLLVIFRVQDRMNQSIAFEHPRQHFTAFHGNGADQNRPALGMQFLDFLDDGVEFFAPGFVN